VGPASRGQMGLHVPSPAGRAPFLGGVRETDILSDIESFSYGAPGFHSRARRFAVSI
jgi:hypothetical protein